ncbi:MAG: proteasome accessory factor [Acidobacteriota bacterium]|nr:proteasome accessory factor [Acidobacteriota bacterium]
MGERLFGMETEYAVTSRAGRADDSVRHGLAWRLMAVARRVLPHLSDFGDGMFLENGSRFYIDSGYHPELSTPECVHPTDVVRYILAGERIIEDLAAKVEAANPSDAMDVFKSNVDYSGTGATWGCHESYMHSMLPIPLSDQIIPHLVSRVIYTGAGGFDSVKPGLSFTLSPRVAHLESVMSDQSTSARGIFHTKDESLSTTGYHRLHLICGESLSSQTAMWLKVATTALVVAMAESGIRFSQKVRLCAPLTALKEFARDPQCKTRAMVSGGVWMTAIEIQRFYLKQAESSLRGRFMPDWAEEACRQWRMILDRLEMGYEGVNTTLDWAIKYTLYKDFVARAGFTWESLSRWTKIHRRLYAAMGYPTDLGDSLSTAKVLDGGGLFVETVRWLEFFMRKHDLQWRDLDGFLRLRRQLFEIDTRMGQLGAGGIFSRLSRSGALTHAIPDIGNLQDFISTPPPSGRARVRGEFVRHVGAERENYACDWQGIWDRQGKRVLDLSDPFASKERWATLDKNAEDLFSQIPPGLREFVRYAEGYRTY